MKVLFLDIDGVLNGHQYDTAAESCKIDPECVKCLNHVLDSTDVLLVISSSWRYMVLRKAMTLTGFEYLLRTHGVHCIGKVFGCLQEDSQVENTQERGQLVRKWIDLHKPDAHAIVDDMQLGFEELNFVQTNGNVGLTMKDAKTLIGFLRARNQA